MESAEAAAPVRVVNCEAASEVAAAMPDVPSESTELASERMEFTSVVDCAAAKTLRPAMMRAEVRMLMWVDGVDGWQQLRSVWRMLIGCLIGGECWMLLEVMMGTKQDYFLLHHI